MKASYLLARGARMEQRRTVILLLQHSHSPQNCVYFMAFVTWEGSAGEAEVCVGHYWEKNTS